ncbi:hypothetical protein CEP54_006593 [Fusarium duplospermum]|uniref:Uncharacterized protein n=1 Tax=Fusarium duplospermum TaxID=1325734 RepID=A0A428Q6A5_9HYPO|nr:hypothetical protein CEP54_006593 [Fusarium duplospermum]
MNIATHAHTSNPRWESPSPPAAEVQPPRKKLHVHSAAWKSQLLVKNSGANGFNCSDPGSPSRVSPRNMTVSVDTLPQTSATSSETAELISSAPATNHTQGELPPPGSHPVHTAKVILLLGLYIQSIQPNDKYWGTMTRMADVAISLVTTRDELTGSLEGIECITIECLYHEATGDLRRAWLAIRRAVAIAQIMGLHRSSVVGNPSETLEQQTRERIDAENLWLRVVQ